MAKLLLKGRRLVKNMLILKSYTMKQINYLPKLFTMMNGYYRKLVNNIGLFNKLPVPDFNGQYDPTIL